MASTQFTDGVTLTAAAWFNDADTVIYAGLTSVAGTNTITATGPASMTAYAARQRFLFLPAVTNAAGGVTINLTCNSVALGARAITKNGSTALAPADLVAGVAAFIVDDGTRYQLLNPQTLGNTQAYNFSFNTDFRIWGAGNATVPTGWAANGGSATYAKNTTAAQFKWGSAGIDVVRVGTDCYASQSIDTITGFGPVGAWKGKTVTLGAWVYATVASRVRLTLADGVGTTSSSYHSGGSSLEFLTVTRAIDASATKVELRLGVDTGNTTGTFSSVVLVQGSTVADFIPPGWTGRKSVFSLGATLGNTIPSGTTAYIGFGNSNGTEGNAQTRVPFKGVARNLHVGAASAPSSGQSFAYTVRKTGAATTVTATISDLNSLAADTTHEAEFAQGDRITAQVVTSASASSVANHNATIEYEEIP